MSDYDDLLFALERLEPETMPLSSKESLKTAASALRTLLSQRENWKETAEQQMRNADFYRGIVCEVGDLFGDAAKTADDGTIMEDVLALVVPGLVEKLLREREEMQAHIDALQARVHLCAGYEQALKERDAAIAVRNVAIDKGLEALDQRDEARAEILRLRVAMAKAAQRADDWPDSNDDPAECLANCASILFDALDYRHVAALAGGKEQETRNNG